MTTLERLCDRTQRALFIPVLDAVCLVRGARCVVPTHIVIANASSPRRRSRGDDAPRSARTKRKSNRPESSFIAPEHSRARARALDVHCVDDDIVGDIGDGMRESARVESAQVDDAGR